jgi:nuclear-control-of-ATPase protein 2
MLELDQILRANELTVAVVAAIPSLLIAGGTGYVLIRWLTPSPPDRKREALPTRCFHPPSKILFMKLV